MILQQMMDSWDRVCGHQCSMCGLSRFLRLYGTTRSSALIQFTNTEALPMMKLTHIGTTCQRYRVNQTGMVSLYLSRLQTHNLILSSQLSCSSSQGKSGDFHSHGQLTCALSHRSFCVPSFNGRPGYTVAMGVGCHVLTCVLAPMKLHVPVSTLLWTWYCQGRDLLIRRAVSPLPRTIPS